MLNSSMPQEKSPLEDRAPEISIIIPAFNEEKRLRRTLERIREYLNTTSAIHGPVEVLVVDDGSADGTARLTQEMTAEMSQLRLISNGRNRGKGYSVRHGMLKASGRIAIFTDADLSSPIEECEKLLAALRSGSDVAIGSRAVDRRLIQVHQSMAREAAGIIFNTLVRLFTGLTFQDTQCGFKAFALQRCRIIFQQQRIEGFGFDPEILFLAQRYGLRTTEIPVRWAHDPATRVHVVRDSIRMFCELMVISLNRFTGRYSEAPENQQQSSYD
jgi:glycosyltransferase involved in cell wall biosynthesis